MPKRPPPASASGETFGQRLTRLRKAAGLTQNALGKEVGLSQRMVAYYEGQTRHPPGTLLPHFARALGVSIDVLLGVKPPPSPRRRPADASLLRRLKALQALPPPQRRQLLAIIDAFLEREALRRSAA